MRRPYPPGKSSVFYIGKGIIISSLVVTSLLSFVLGYFVGKSMRSPAGDQAAFVTPPADTGRQNVETGSESPPADQPRQTGGIQTAELQETPNAPAATSDNRRSGDAGAKKILKPRETKTHKGSAAMTKDEGTSKYGKPTTNSGTSHEPARVIYTVQIGAFRNSAEADSLKSKFVEKGYKVFITTWKNKNKTLYRVMIGEFHHRKDADLLSVKIRKKEGLRTFVTIRRD